MSIFWYDLFMPKLKTFFYSFRQSFNPSYYSDVLKAPKRFSWLFFLFFCFIYGLIYTVVVNTMAIPSLKNFSNQLASKIYTFYPENLEITIKDKQVSINQEEPYFIPLNFRDVFGEDLPDSVITNLLVINTGSENPTKDIKDYSTLALLTKDSFAIKGEANETRVFSLNDMEIDDLFIDYGLYKNILDKIVPYFPYISKIISSIITVIFLIIVPLTKLIHLAVFSLLAMLISSLVKPKLTYSQTFQIGLHAFVVPTLITELVKFTSFRPAIPLYSVLFLIYFLLILSRLETKKHK